MTPRGYRLLSGGTELARLSGRAVGVPVVVGDTAKLVKQLGKIRSYPLDIYQASLSKTDCVLDVKKRRI